MNRTCVALSSEPILSMAILLCLAMPWQAHGEASPQQPNIVLFLADDLNYCDLACYGNPDVRTPAIDRLAREGLRFTQAYTATAMCGPTRMQLYTGIYPVRSGGFPNHSRVKAGTKSIVHYLRDRGYRVGLSNKGHVGPPDSFPFEILPGMDREKWREFMTRSGTEPFCLAICSSQPHAPWDQGEPSQYSPAEITVPPFMVDNRATREALCRYYGEITYLDQELSGCLETLRDENLEEHTLVLFSSEQGAGVPNSKWTCYDLGLRVALIARWPGQIAAGRTTDALVNYVDVVPTLLDVIDGGPPGGSETGYDFDGTSFKSVLLGESSTHNRYAYGVHTQANAIGAPPSGYPVRSVRNGRYKYILNENFEVMFSDHR
jgi:N-sulfoglucosamine sulfohydrolase